MNNYDQYKSPQWQKRKSEIMALNDFRCQNCMKKGQDQLHVHHINYEYGRKLWDYDDNELLCLSSPPPPFPLVIPLAERHTMQTQQLGVLLLRCLVAHGMVVGVYTWVVVACHFASRSSASRLPDAFCIFFRQETSSSSSLTLAWSWSHLVFQYSGICSVDSLTPHLLLLASRLKYSVDFAHRCIKQGYIVMIIV